MSSVDDVSKADWISTTEQYIAPYSTRNYATLGLSIGGTISSGTFTVEGTTDGVTWEELPVAKGNTALAANEITQTGAYIVGVAGYAQARIVPDSFTGQIQITANISTRIPQTFTAA